jgi:phosphoserine phosphatase RsbU/P
LRTGTLARDRTEGRVADDNDGWAGTLHRLWTSVVAITARDQLAELVLPALQTLPGVVAVWGVRHGPSREMLAFRSTGVPPEGPDRAEVERLARELYDQPGVVPVRFAVPGVDHLVIAGFSAPGVAGGTILVATGPGADLDRVARCLGQVVDVTREAVLRLLARRGEEEQLVRDALLAEASVQMDAVLDPAQTMQRVARMAVPAVAEGCLVFLRENARLVLGSSVHVDMRYLTGILKDETALQSLIDLATEAVSAPVERGWDDDRRVHAQVLRARGRVLGVLLFLFDRDRGLIPQPAFLRDLAHRAALAIDNSELYEQRRREVVTLQQHLLPRRLPVSDGLTMAASYVVGDRILEVGGDFYDVVVRRDGTMAALIGDVCGRGADAAALTGMSRHTLGSLLHEGVSPPRALARLNTGLRRDGSWRFVTVGVAVLRPVDGGVSVQWTSAGHPAPVVLRRDGRSEQGRGGGVALGVTDPAWVGRSRLLLAPGDTLIMFTDGLTESRNEAGEMFETAALGQTLRRLRDAPLDVLVAELSRTSRAFGVTGTDDIAVLAIRAEGQDGD